MSIISLSIVIYKTSIIDLEKIYNSILLTNTKWKLYLVDNSPTNELSTFALRDERIEYIFNNSNIGFGAGHNVAINKAIKSGIDFHFIVNPDIFFIEDVITKMLRFIEDADEVGMIMPEILSPDNTVQYLPKLLPSPLSLILRKLKWPKFLHENFLLKYELRSVPRKAIYNVPVLSGCFTLLRLKAVMEIGMYDDSYFMYFEDWDLSRRMHEKYKTIYYPEVSVYHGYDSGANKNSKLFKSR